MADASNTIKPPGRPAVPHCRRRVPRRCRHRSARRCELRFWPRRWPGQDRSGREATMRSPLALIEANLASMAEPAPCRLSPRSRAATRQSCRRPAHLPAPPGAIPPASPMELWRHPSAACPSSTAQISPVPASITVMVPTLPLYSRVGELHPVAQPRTARRRAWSQIARRRQPARPVPGAPSADRG